MDLFGEKPTKSQPSGVKKPLPPLADRLRPGDLDGFVGQSHLIGPDRVLRRIIEGDVPSSMIFWGPPGVGKTTLAKIISNKTDASFFPISAVTAGLADVRKIINRAKKERQALGRKTILFIDEIHRFNKAQQDALLHSVEDGTIILIGATTENPSFEVIAPLLSRCRVYRLNPLGDDDIHVLLQHALNHDLVLRESRVSVSDEVLNALVQLASGDGRHALNSLELCSRLAVEENGARAITLEIVREAAQRRALSYDKKGDYHYDIISAFIKSVRGSDPDAAVYWLARMIESGEDPLFIARRMIILASEDIGNADPRGLQMASAAFQAVHAIGMPEGRIVLSQVATYLASAPKSNAAYLAINTAQETVRNSQPQPVPMHIRNAPTSLMKNMGYSEGYQYAHDFEGGFVEQVCLPEKLKDRIFYHPKEIGEEKKIKRRLETWWSKRRKAVSNRAKSKED